MFHVVPLTYIHSCNLVLLTLILTQRVGSRVTTRNKGRPLLFPEVTTAGFTVHPPLSFYDPRQLKQKLYQSQQRATLCSRAADEAQQSRGEAEKSRAVAETRALGCQRDKGAAEADRSRLSEELQQLKKEVWHRYDQLTFKQLIRTESIGGTK